MFLAAVQQRSQIAYQSSSLGQLMIVRVGCNKAQTHKNDKSSLLWGLNYVSLEACKRQILYLFGGLLLWPPLRKPESLHYTALPC